MFMSVITFTNLYDIIQFLMGLEMAFKDDIQNFHTRQIRLHLGIDKL